MKAIAMKKNPGIIVGLVTLAVLLGAAVAYGDDPAVKISRKEGVGAYLTDAKGMALYYFKNDTPGKSACAGPCAEKWPPFFGEKAAGYSGLSPRDFGMIMREDGKKQTTYKDKPLYYFSGDAKAGDTNGQSVRDVWYVVNP